MASDLIKFEKAWLRPIRKKTVGGTISFYATAELDMYINPKLVQEVLTSFGIGPNGENIHKILMSDRKEHYINDDALHALLN